MTRYLASIRDLALDLLTAVALRVGDWVDERGRR